MVLINVHYYSVSRFSEAQKQTNKQKENRQQCLSIVETTSIDNSYHEE